MCKLLCLNTIVGCISQQDRELCLWSTGHKPSCTWTPAASDPLPVGMCHSHHPQALYFPSSILQRTLYRRIQVSSSILWLVVHMQDKALCLTHPPPPPPPPHTHTHTKKNNKNQKKNKKNQKPKKESLWSWEQFLVSLHHQSSLGFDLL